MSASDAIKRINELRIACIICNGDLDLMTEGDRSVWEHVSPAMDLGHKPASDKPRTALDQVFRAMAHHCGDVATARWAMRRMARELTGATP